MPIPKPFIAVRIDYLQAAAEALRYKAHNEAGHSTGCQRFTAESTYDWQAAQAIDGAIRVQNRTRAPAKCKTCGSVGFVASVLGPDRCTFCDGTEGGQSDVR